MKNGFTLVEILATLAILSIVAIVVTINIPKNVEKAEKEELQSFAEKAEKAACTYIELNAYSERKKNCRNNASIVKSDCRSQCNKNFPWTNFSKDIRNARQECKSKCDNSSNYYFCDISLAELKIAGLLSQDDIDEYADYIEKNNVNIEDNRLYQLANNNPTDGDLETQLKTNTGLPDSDFQELKKMLKSGFQAYEGQTVEVLWVNNAKKCYFVPAVADDLLD